MTLCLLFTGRFNDIGGPIQATRWIAAERKKEIKQIKAAKNRKTRRAAEILKQAIVEETKTLEPTPQPLPSLLPDIEALIDAYDLLQGQIANLYAEEARQMAEMERARLVTLRNQMLEEEDLLISLILSTL